MFRAALLLLFLQITSALVVSVADDCKLPTWTVKDLKIKSKDTVGNTGTASFTITPGATGKAETLTCTTLQANYRCHIASKVDPGVEVDLQINMQVAHVSITQMKFACGSSTISIAGNIDLDLTCGANTGGGPGGDTSCASSETATIQTVLI